MATVTIVSPPEGATLTGVVTVRVDAPSVQKVYFYVDGVIRSRVNRPPFTFDWYTDRWDDGRHVVKAVSSNGRYSDTAGYTTSNHVPAPITVKVSGVTKLGQTLTAVVS